MRFNATRFAATLFVAAPPTIDDMLREPKEKLLAPPRAERRGDAHA
jgi:hypothetical protein